MQPTKIRSKVLLVGLLLGSSLLVLSAVGVAAVRAQGDPTLTVAQQNIDSGQAATLTAVVTGVPSGATYILSWSMGPGTPICPATPPPIQSGVSTTFVTPTLTASTTYCVMLDAGTGGTAVTNVTVTVNPALVAPVVSASQPMVASGQSANLTTTTAFSGGTSFFAYQWLEEAPGGGWVTLGSPFTSTAPSRPSMSTGALAASGIWYFDLTVTDSSQTPEKVTSNIVSVTVAGTSTSSSSSTSTGQSSTSTSTGQSSTSLSTSAAASGFPWGSVAIAVVAIVAVVGGLAYGLTRRKGAQPKGSDDTPPGGNLATAPVDPCAGLKKARQDASDEYLALYKQYVQVLETPPIDGAKADQMLQAVDALRAKIDALDKAIANCQGGPGGPPPPPPPPPPAPTNAVPPVVPLPLTRAKPKPPCDEGDTQDVASCECEVNLALVAGAKIEYEEVYQMSKEDVDKAIKGLETFLSVTAVATKLQGLLTEPVEIVANMIDHISTETASDSAVDGLKELNEKLEKFKDQGKKALPMVVTLPIARFRFSCRTTKECQGGQWVVHRTSGMTMLGPGDPSSISFEPTATSASNIKGQIATRAATFNSAANTAINNCLKNCE